MKLHRQDGWKRRGLTLLWDPQALRDLIDPAQVLSMRACLGLQSRWPDDLPGHGGDALVVAGLEGCLDVLAEADAVTWLEHDLRRMVLDFQAHYDGQAALILWLPAGRTRLVMDRASGAYLWRLQPGKDDHTLPIGRALWAGAESDAARVIRAGERDPDVDGEAWIGLHHPRIS